MGLRGQKRVVTARTVSSNGTWTKQSCHCINYLSNYLTYYIMTMIVIKGIHPEPFWHIKITYNLTSVWGSKNNGNTVYSMHNN